MALCLLKVWAAQGCGAAANTDPAGALPFKPPPSRRRPRAAAARAAQGTDEQANRMEADEFDQRLGGRPGAGRGAGAGRRALPERGEGINRVDDVFGRRQQRERQLDVEERRPGRERMGGRRRDDWDDLGRW